MCPGTVGTGALGRAGLALVTSTASYQEIDSIPLHPSEQTELAMYHVPSNMVERGTTIRKTKEGKWRVNKHVLGVNTQAISGVIPSAFICLPLCPGRPPPGDFDLFQPKNRDWTADAGHDPELWPPLLETADEIAARNMLHVFDNPPDKQSIVTPRRK